MTNEARHKLIRTSFIAAVFILFACMFWPFFTPILLAALFSFGLYDVVTKIAGKRFKRSTASLLMLLAILVFVASPLGFVVAKSVSTVKYYSSVGLESSPLYQSAQNFLHDITDLLTDLAGRLDIDISKMTKPADLLSEYAGGFGAFATKLVTKLPHLAMSFLVFFLVLYYFLNESGKIRQLFLKFDLLSESEIDQLIGIIKNSAYLTLIASLLIGGLQALVVTLFAYFCGYNEFVIVFIVTFAFTLIPVVGSAPVSLFLAISLFIQGSTGAGVAMLIGLAIASSLDNLIKPFILAKNEDLHPIVSLLALIGAVLVFGPPGILLGPVLTQLAFNILPILSTEGNSGSSDL